jgi:hypothetical protein
MDTLKGPDQPYLSQPKSNLGNQQNFSLEWIVGPRKRGHPAECFVGPYLSGALHLVECGVQPKEGGSILAIEGMAWAHISRQQGG